MKNKFNCCHLSSDCSLFLQNCVLCSKALHPVSLIVCQYQQQPKPLGRTEHEDNGESSAAFLVSS